MPINWLKNYSHTIFVTRLQVVVIVTRPMVQNWDVATFSEFNWICLETLRWNKFCGSWWENLGGKILLLFHENSFNLNSNFLSEVDIVLNRRHLRCETEQIWEGQRNYPVDPFPPNQLIRWFQLKLVSLGPFFKKIGIGSFFSGTKIKKSRKFVWTFRETA